MGISSCVSQFLLAPSSYKCWRFTESESRKLGLSCFPRSRRSVLRSWLKNNKARSAPPKIQHFKSFPRGNNFHFNLDAKNEGNPFLTGTIKCCPSSRGCFPPSNSQFSSFSICYREAATRVTRFNRIPGKADIKAYGKEVISQDESLKLKLKLNLFSLCAALS